jgi:two-component system, NtrC family, sensor kinase
MRTQHIVIFFAVFAVFVSAIVWRVDGLMFGDRLNWSEAQARAQMSAIVQSLETENSSLSTLLSLGYTEVELSKKDFPADKAYGKFEMMAKLLPPNQKADGEPEWKIASNFYKEKSAVKQWSTAYVRMVLRNINEREIKPGSSNIYALMDPQRKSYLLILYHGVGNWYAGLLDSSALQSTMDRQKGQMSSVFVVNQKGQALGHTVHEYVGSLLSEDPIVAELMHSAMGSGAGIFKNLKGQSVQGFYEQVGMSNMFVVITTPVALLTESRTAVIFQLIVMGLGLCLIGLAAFVYFYNPEAGQKAVKVFATALRQQAKPAIVKAVAEVKAAIPSLKKAPPVAVEIPAALPASLPKQERFVRPEKNALAECLKLAIHNVQSKIDENNIELKTEIETVRSFSVSSELMTRALENILSNAIESMDYAPRKNLTIKLSEKLNKIYLSIADTGVGMDEIQKSRATEPFFTTKSGSHVGMGLSLASGIVKGSYGEVHLNSGVGRGTQVELIFNPPLEKLQDFPVEIAPAQQKVEINAIDPSIESMIDDLDGDVFELTPITQDDEFFHQSLAFEKSSMPVKSSLRSGAIDKPSIDFKRKVSKLDELEVSIRRPGEYL